MKIYRIITDSNEHLQHYGVKGMKWGVIRTPEQLGHRPSKKKKAALPQNQKRISEIAKRHYERLVNDPFFLIDDGVTTWLPERILWSIEEEVWDEKTNQKDWKRYEKLLKQAADQHIKPVVDEYINKLAKESPEKLDSDELLHTYEFMHYYWAKKPPKWWSREYKEG